MIDYVGWGSGEVIDVGCGEGRVSRLMKSGGYRVTAVDPIQQLIQAAEEAESADRYVVASADNLPFGDNSFDLAVAYNVLMDVDDLPGTVKEIARVLRPTGVLFVSIVHPLADLEMLDSGEREGPSHNHQTYFEERRFDNEEESAGLRMHFAGWARPIQVYSAALENAALAITSIREPTPELSIGRDHLKPWARLPLFLWLKARSLELS